MAYRRPLNVMVTAIGAVDDKGKVRQSLHMFNFESEEQLDEWLALAPVKQIQFGDGPDVHVELPRTNRRNED